MLLRIAFFFVGLLLAYPAYAEGTMRVITPAHDIARGQIISDADVVYGTIPSNTVFSGILTSVDDIKGMEARRVLHAGEVVRSDDVRRPIVVTKGAIVTMTFEAPGVILTATGRAMSEGGVGDTVTVQNPASFRQISCIVTGPGAVRASTAGITIGPARVAAAH